MGRKIWYFIAGGMNFPFLGSNTLDVYLDTVCPSATCWSDRGVNERYEIKLGPDRPENDKIEIMSRVSIICLSVTKMG